MSESSTRVPLSDLVPALYAAGYQGETSYGKAWLATANGKIPCKRNGRTREVEREDFPIAADVLGLELATA